jgi:putative phosphoribosyl transferase
LRRLDGSILYSIYRPFNQYENIQEKTVNLGDDVAATGATLIAAARSLKMKHTPKPLVIAVPVVPKHTVKLLRHESDEVIVVTSPSIFRSVEQFYHDFEQVLDDKVMEILRIRNGIDL